MVPPALGPAQTALISVLPDADSFVRSLAPTNNYGAGGALSISGAAAVNSLGEQNGLFASLMRFSTSNAVASLDNALGGPDWIVTQVSLVLTEMATPDDAIFNRGIGDFEVRWIASDNWLEGKGKPNLPTTDSVSWQDLPLILNSNLDVSVGIFTNRGIDGPISCSLALRDPLIQDLRQGGEVGFYLTARSPDVGFTFNSRNFGNTNAQPLLLITAVANPHARMDTIAPAGTNVSISFAVVSNWTYTLQGTCETQDASSGWSNLMVVVPQSTNSRAVFVDGITNRKRFYRISVAP